MTQNTDLFSPVRVGALELANRIVMAPLTRSRAGSAGVPGPLNAEYYAQRASAGLIVTEATNISQQGRGYAYTPGIYNEAQVAGWKLVTEAVHAKGGKIVSQLWHVGRISHPDLQPGGALPVAPSAVRPAGKAFTEGGFKDHPTPRALETDEIAGLVADYRHAAECAKRAGFDGVEIHAANGYLLHQFLADKTNLRTDRYGGSIENRIRLVIEVVQAVTEVWGAERVGIRISPLTHFSDIDDSNPQAVFTALVDALDSFGLAYLHVIEGETGGERHPAGGFDMQILRRRFHGAFMANNGIDLALAIRMRAENEADLVCIGRAFISNPDLVERWRDGKALTTPDQATFYGGDAHGYTDYQRAD